VKRELKPLAANWADKLLCTQRQWRINLYVCCLCCCSSILEAKTTIDTAWFEQHDFSAVEQQKFQRGQVVRHHNSNTEPRVQDVQAFVLIHAPIADVFNLITDFPQLVTYAPYVEKIEVLQQSAQMALVNYDMALPFGVHKRYRLQLHSLVDGSNRRLSWTLAPWPGLKPDETLVATSGYWFLEPAKLKNHTLLSYHTRTDSGDIPFGLGWIVTLLSQSGVTNLLQKTKERAEQQWQKP